MQLSDVIREIQPQLNRRTPPVILKTIATQIIAAREARERVDEEGSVVRDTKGSVVPHPAIKIEADAIKIYTALIAKYTTLH
jgi:hypothetical protein